MQNPAACKHVGVYIRRIGGFDHERGARAVEQVEDVPQLVAGAAGNKHLVRRERYAAPRVMVRYRFAQKRRAAFGHIAVKAGFVRLIVNRLVQSADNRATERQRHVADAHAVEMRIGMLAQIRADLLRDAIKQIGILQFRIMRVERNHSTVSPS